MDVLDAVVCIIEHVPQSLHLLTCFLSNLALMWLVLIVLSCAAVIIDSVSLFTFPICSYIQVFSLASSFVILMNGLCSCSYYHFLSLSYFSSLLFCLVFFFYSVSCCGNYSFGVLHYIFFWFFFVLLTQFSIQTSPLHPSFLFT